MSPQHMKARSAGDGRHLRRTRTVAIAAASSLILGLFGTASFADDVTEPVDDLVTTQAATGVDPAGLPVDPPLDPADPGTDPLTDPPSDPTVDPADPPQDPVDPVDSTSPPSDPPVNAPAPAGAAPNPIDPVDPVVRNAPPVGATGPPAARVQEQIEIVDVHAASMPTKAMVWTVVDGEGSLLGGQTFDIRRNNSDRADRNWTITDCEAEPCTGPDIDPAPGQFMVADIGTYQPIDNQSWRVRWTPGQNSARTVSPSDWVAKTVTSNTLVQYGAFRVTEVQRTLHPVTVMKGSLRTGTAADKVGTLGVEGIQFGLYDGDSADPFVGCLFDGDAPNDDLKPCVCAADATGTCKFAHVDRGGLKVREIGHADPVASPFYPPQKTVTLGSSSSLTRTAYEWTLPATLTTAGTEIPKASTATANRVSSGWVANVVKNPPLVEPDCGPNDGISVAVVMDLSSSMYSWRSDLRNAADGFIDALAGDDAAARGNSLALFSFANNAPAGATTAPNYPTPLNLDDPDNVALLKTYTTQYRTFLTNAGSNGQATNWDRGLYSVANAMDDHDYDLVLILTDGNPTKSASDDGSGNTTTFRELERAAFSANAIKMRADGSQGARVMTIGIGGNASENNIQMTSGPVKLTENMKLSDADYVMSDWATLSAKLKSLGQSLSCQAGVTVQKLAGVAGEDHVAANGWEFTVGATGADVADPTQTTSGTDALTGTAQWDVTFAKRGDTADVTLTENPSADQIAEGYQLAGVTCSVNGAPHVPATVVGTTVTIEDVEIGDSISCIYTNTKAALEPITVTVHKTETGLGIPEGGRPGEGWSMGITAGSGAVDDDDEKLTGADGATDPWTIIPDDGTGSTVVAHESMTAQQGADWTRMDDLTVCRKGPEADAAVLTPTEKAAPGTDVHCYFTNKSKAAELVVDKFWKLPGNDALIPHDELLPSEGLSATLEVTGAEAKDFGESIPTKHGKAELIQESTGNTHETWGPGCTITPTLHKAGPDGRPSGDRLPWGDPVTMGWTGNHYTITNTLDCTQKIQLKLDQRTVVNGLPVDHAPKAGWTLTATPGTGDALEFAADWSEAKAVTSAVSLGNKWTTPLGADDARARYVDEPNSWTCTNAVQDPIARTWSVKPGFTAVCTMKTAHSELTVLNRVVDTRPAAQRAVESDWTLSATPPSSILGLAPWSADGAGADGIDSHTISVLGGTDYMLKAVGKNAKTSGYITTLERYAIPEGGPKVDDDWYDDTAWMQADITRPVSVDVNERVIYRFVHTYMPTTLKVTKTYIDAAGQSHPGQDWRFEPVTTMLEGGGAVATKEADTTGTATWTLEHVFDDAARSYDADIVLQEYAPLSWSGEPWTMTGATCTVTEPGGREWTFHDLEKMERIEPGTDIDCTITNRSTASALIVEKDWAFTDGAEFDRNAEVPGIEANAVVDGADKAWAASTEVTPAQVVTIGEKYTVDPDLFGPRCAITSTIVELDADGEPVGQPQTLAKDATIDAAMDFGMNRYLIENTVDCKQSIFATVGPASWSQSLINDGLQRGDWTIDLTGTMTQSQAGVLFVPDALAGDYALAHRFTGDGGPNGDAGWAYVPRDGADWGCVAKGEGTAPAITVTDGAFTAPRGWDVDCELVLIRSEITLFNKVVGGVADAADWQLKAVPAAPAVGETAPAETFSTPGAVPTRDNAAQATWTKPGHGYALSAESNDPDVTRHYTLTAVEKYICEFDDGEPYEWGDDACWQKVGDTTADVLGAAEGTRDVYRFVHEVTDARFQVLKNWYFSDSEGNDAFYPHGTQPAEVDATLEIGQLPDAGFGDWSDVDAGTTLVIDEAVTRGLAERCEFSATIWRIGDEDQPEDARDWKPLVAGVGEAVTVDPDEFGEDGYVIANFVDCSQKMRLVKDIQDDPDNHLRESLQPDAFTMVANHQREGDKVWNQNSLSWVDATAGETYTLREHLAADLRGTGGYTPVELDDDGLIWACTGADVTTDEWGAQSVTVPWGVDVECTVTNAKSELTVLNKVLATAADGTPVGEATADMWSYTVTPQAEQAWMSGMSGPFAMAQGTDVLARGTEHADHTTNVRPGELVGLTQDNQVDGYYLSHVEKYLPTQEGVVPRVMAALAGGVTCPLDVLSEDAACWQKLTLDDVEAVAVAQLDRDIYRFVNAPIPPKPDPEVPSLLVDKVWTVDGTGYVHGDQPEGLEAALELKGVEATGVAFGDVTDTAVGDVVTIDESATVDAVKLGKKTCEMTATVRPAGADGKMTGDAVALGEGFEATMAEGLNRYVVINTVTCEDPDTPPPPPGDDDDDDPVPPPADTDPEPRPVYRLATTSSGSGTSAAPTYKLARTGAQVLTLMMAAGGALALGGLAITRRRREGDASTD